MNSLNSSRSLLALFSGELPGLVVLSEYTYGHVIVVTNFDISFLVFGCLW